jgi:hypothetical protein
LKGEEPLELRLMDDIVVPQAVAHSFQGSNRPPYASSPSSFVQPSNPQGMQPAGLKANDVTDGASVANVASAPDAAVANGETTRFTILVLKSGQLYEATKYRVNDDVLLYRLLDGTQGAVNTSDIDWRKTTEMTANVRSVDLPSVTSQTH